MRYEDLYNEWKNDPEKFWINAAQNIDWIKFPSFALDSSNTPFYKWFPDGLVNTCSVSYTHLTLPTNREV